MAERKEEYVLKGPDGLYHMDGQRTTDRSKADYMAPGVILGFWNPLTPIPPEYAIATAKHEGALNQVDTEPSGFVSWGPFQVSDEERKKVGLPDANLVNMMDTVIVFAKLSETNLHNLLNFLSVPYPTTREGMFALNPQVWPYLAMVHNQGLTATMNNIHNHGFDWERYKREVPNIEIVKHGYGDYVLNLVTHGVRPGEPERNL